MPGTEEKNSGTILAIGGSAKSTLLKLVRLAGGSRAHIAVVPHASASPRAIGDEVMDALRKAGCGKSTLLLPRQPGGIPADATAVYMSGGDQARLVRLASHQLKDDLERFQRSGGLIAGSSAGAAALAPTMIAGGMSDGILRPGSLQLREGLGLAPGMIFDTHFRERARFGRLMAAATLLPGTVGIGLDEDTAVEITPAGRVLVHGRGHAWFFRAGSSCASTLNRRTLKASAGPVEVIALSDGAGFEPATWRWDAPGGADPHLLA